MDLTVVFLVREEMRKSDARTIRLYALTLGTTIVCLATPISWQTQFCLSGLFLCYFTWCLGQHWITIATAAPVSPADATLLIKRWSRQIMLALGFTVAVMLFGLSTENYAIAWSVLGGFAFVQLWSKREKHSLPRFRMFFTILASWRNYHISDRDLLGVVSSPIAAVPARRWALLAAVFLFDAALARAISSLTLDATSSPPYELNRIYGIQPEVVNFLQLVFLRALPLFLIPGLLPFRLLHPVLLESSHYRQRFVRPDAWSGLIDTIQDSPDTIEKNSIFVGRVVKDGSPLLIPSTVFAEHAHFLGDSGSGKTSLGLAPWLEQMIRFGDCSVVVVDLKADSMELFASLVKAADELRLRTGQALPLKHYTNQSHLSTFAFNPLTQPYWDNFDPYIKTDILCGAYGLLYGSDYGQGWYSAANAAVLHHAIKEFPGVATFRELADKVNDILHSKQHSLHAELRSAGVHVHAVLERLASFDNLNVAPSSGHPTDVVEQAIELSQVFQKPQLLYFHLSATLGAGSSPEIARLLVYSLLCAATQVKRKHQVFLVIDEFQRMVAHNVEYMLQLARSMGVGVILANQGMQDLKTLIPAIESNCRYRQWFAASGLLDRERLSKLGGETMTYRTSFTHSGINENSITFTEERIERLTMNDIALMGDHPMRSVVQLTRGSGYAQLGGLPVIVESCHHISKEEYEHRKAMPWPAAGNGCYIPREFQAQHSPQAITPPLTATLIDSLGLPAQPPPAVTSPPPPTPPTPQRRRTPRNRPPALSRPACSIARTGHTSFGGEPGSRVLSAAL